jgi:ABC-type nitrate/sulfonate/bicarbonate transport system substrate-binding protein
MKLSVRYAIVAAIAVILVAVALFGLGVFDKPSSAVRLGISPYQDTAMPTIAEAEGFFAKQKVDVQLQTVPWENIVPALASRGKTVDVAIGSINTFLPRADAVNAGNSDPVVFYAPLYVFRGASLLAGKNSGLVPYKELLKRNGGDRRSALRALMAQLRGKRIGLPSGTPYDQLFLQAARDGGATPADFAVRDVQLAEALPALLSGGLDVAAAGVTQRTEAARHGDYVLLETDDLGFAEIVGLVTTRSYARSHAKDLEAIRRAWFDTIQLLRADPKRASRSVLSYLAQNASTKYSFAEYMTSLQAQEFPATAAEADAMFARPDGRYHWKRTWDIVNNYLLATGKIKTPVPDVYFYPAGQQ